MRIPALVVEQKDAPFEEQVRHYEMGDIEEALADSKSGDVVKPILRMSVA